MILDFNSYRNSWLCGFVKLNFSKYNFIDHYFNKVSCKDLPNNSIIYLDDEDTTAWEWALDPAVNKNIILICKIKEVYKKLSKLGYKCLYYPYWVIVDDAIAMKKLLEFINVTPTHNRDYSFCCLNRRKTYDRDQVIKELSNLDLIKHGYVTYHQLVRHDPVTYHHEPNHLNGLQLDPSMEHYLISGDMGPERHNHQLNNIGYSSLVANYFFIQKNISAAINISVETTMQPFFPTEKSFLGFFTKKIPIVLAEPNRMSELETEGFDIFHDYVNHRYDSLADPMQRISTALKDNYNLLSNFDIDITDRANANFDFLINEWLDKKLIELYSGINELICL
jgi:hypothetical protein